MNSLVCCVTKSVKTEICNKQVMSFCIFMFKLETEKMCLSERQVLLQTVLWNVWCFCGL